MEEILNSIREAEENAVKLKSQAVEKAGAMLDGARQKAAEIEREAAAERLEYRNSCLADARAQAEKNYKAAVSESGERAKKYADKIITTVDGEISKIVGRICDGNS